MIFLCVLHVFHELARRFGDAVELARLDPFLVGKVTADTDKVMAGRKQFHYSKEQKQQYTTIGGAADLDGYYTVFGEIVEGLDVLTKIEKRAVDSRLRPIEPVIIKRVREIEWSEE